MDGHFQKACGIRQECLRHQKEMVPSDLISSLAHYRHARH